MGYVDGKPFNTPAYKENELETSALRLLVLSADMTFEETALLVGCTTWTVQMKIRALEKSIGQKMFIIRGPRRSITVAGRILIAYARQILSLHDEVLTSLRNGEVGAACAPSQSASTEIVDSPVNMILEPPIGPLPKALDAIEKRAIVSAVRGAGGNRLRAAKMLGIGRSTLYRRLKEYGNSALKTSVTPSSRDTR